MTTATTAHTNRLRALLLSGDDTDRQLSRGALTQICLTSWPGADHHARPAASRSYDTPRSAASRSP